MQKKDRKTGVIFVQSSMIFCDCHKCQVYEMSTSLHAVSIEVFDRQCFLIVIFNIHGQNNDLMHLVKF